MKAKWQELARLARTWRHGLPCVLLSQFSHREADFVFILAQPAKRTGLLCPSQVKAREVLEPILCAGLVRYQRQRIACSDGIQSEYQIPKTDKSPKWTRTRVPTGFHGHFKKLSHCCIALWRGLVCLDGIEFQCPNFHEPPELYIVI